MAVEAVEAVEAVVTRSVVAVVGPVAAEVRSVVPVGPGCVVAELGPVTEVGVDVRSVV